MFNNANTVQVNNATDFLSISQTYELTFTRTVLAQLSWSVSTANNNSNFYLTLGANDGSTMGTYARAEGNGSASMNFVRTFAAGDIL